MILLLLPAALAAAPGAPGYVPPAVQVDLLRPTVDARGAVAVEDARAAPGASASVVLGHAGRPLVWRGDDGEDLAIVRGATAAWLLAGWGAGPLRIGVAVPAYLSITSDLSEPRGTALGDPSLDVKLALPGAADRPVSAALLGRLVAPAGDETAQVGAPGWGGEAGAALDLRAGRLDAAANLVARLAPATSLGDLDAGGAGQLRLSAAWRLQPGAALQAELHAQQSWGQLLRFEAPAAAEVLVGGWAQPDGGPRIRGAVGTGLGGAPGSPQWRLVLGVGLPAPPPPEAP